jgi:type IV pilus assembly protein PilY1
MNRNSFIVAAAAIAALVLPLAAPAQTTVSEDFTGTTTSNSWYFFNGACLTAGSAVGVEPSGTSGGQLPGCTAIGIGGAGPLYYNENLVGGYNGASGSTQTLPDPTGHGALRFTNGNLAGGGSPGSAGGLHQNGGIVSATPFPTGQGIAVTFKTVTYRGDGGGSSDSDGADGMSFFLMDATKLNTASINGVASGNGNGLGSWGGSLAYTCSNSNAPYNGLIGGYVGLGIDEYGNFLNGTSITNGETGTTASGDNTASGGGYKAPRIGMRGAGNVAWNTLTGAYGTNPGSSSSPYYPSSLATSCLNGGGTYNSSTGVCEICATGTTYNSSANQCEKCSSGTYLPATNNCTSCPSGQTYDATTNTCQSCSSGSYDPSTNNCTSCPSGQTYDSTTQTCQSCPSGQYYNSTNNDCEICASGSYVSSTGTCSSCPSGQTWDSTTNQCESCSSGTYNASTNTCYGSCASGTTWNGNTDNCQSCASGYTYDAVYNSSGSCYKCSGTKVYNAGYGTCCPSGNTYNSSTGKCSGGTSPTSATSGTLTTSNPTTATGTAGNSPTTGTPNSNASNASTTNSPNAPTASSPTTANPDSYYAVQNTCKNGTLYNYSSATAPSSAGAASLSNTLNVGLASANIAPILDYLAIPNAYSVLPSGTLIANESAMSRGAATPIFYDLEISQNGLLSLSYSINGGSYQQIIKSQSITASNGPLPANFLFGFAGSTGGDSNIHEILCFKATPQTSAASSAGASQRQSAKLETGAQAYFAFYNPNGWIGRVTASSLSIDQYGNVTVAATPNWDAECVLTGVASGSTCATTGAAGPTTAQGPTNRTILTWNGSVGIPFEYNNLSTSQQATIDTGDVTSAACNSSTAYATNDRVNYLRGDRSCEINSQAVGLFRARDSVLGDIIDSSPAWVGPPDAPYPANWVDRLYSTATMAEDASGAPTYVQYTQSNETRLNVVYTGANDGLLHGFRSGSYNANGTFCSTSTNCSGTVTPNDGEEVLAYMPNAVLQVIHNSTTPSVDFSNSQYGHAFYVDATPGTGDLFYDNAWHTWVVGGLGPGGAAIYALDVTNPTNFAEGNAGSLVIGEWTPTTIACAGSTGTNSGGNCGNNLGNTYGTPTIRRLHNGDWAVIFGNGLGSASGDAGIFIMTINPSSSTTTFYYLSTGTAGQSNGIAYASPVDLDGDHITDYVYAGDLLGNVWRFDLTSNNPSSWAVTPGPVFKTPTGQPITTSIAAASGPPYAGMANYLMLLFGTGEKFPLTNLNPATYATGTQTLYGVWDWNLTTWDGISSVQYAALSETAAGLSGNGTLAQANLTAQVATINASTGDRDMTSVATICFKGTSVCTTTANNSFGWYLNLPGTQEQIIYSPEIVQQAITVNSIVPATNDPTSCAIPTDTGFTYVFYAMTGGVIDYNGNGVFLPPSEASNPTVNSNPAYLDASAIGMQTNATGSSFITGNSSGTMFLIYETNQVQGGTGSSNIQSGTLGLNLPPNTTGRRIGWVERR